MKSSWPKIRKTLNHGKPAYLVDARISGRGERRFFEKKTDADVWAQAQRIKRQNQGETAFDDRELARFGWTVSDAIRFSLEHLRRQSASVSLEKSVEALVSARRSEQCAERYCHDLELRLAKLVAAFPTQSIAEIRTGDLEDFLSRLKVAPQTRNTFRRDIRTLWSFAETRGWALADTAKKTKRAREVPQPPGILTPAQGQALIEASEDPALLAFHAIGMFAGLRVAEIVALEWSAVDLEGGFINVAAAVSKTRSRRLVPILPNLRAILEPIKAAQGKVAPQLRLRQLHEAARREAGFEPPTKEEKKQKVLPNLLPWPDNAMRHSFVSYRLAATGNAAQTALESGHDQAVLFRHYRELVRPTEAAKWWGILPPK